MNIATIVILKLLEILNIFGSEKKFTEVEHEVRSIQSYIKIDCVEFSTNLYHELFLGIKIGLIKSYITTNHTINIILN